MAGRIVGIDLGTTNSEVAAVTDRGVEILEEDGTGILPSCVGLAPDGRVLVGVEAVNQETLHPDRTARSVKRLMGTEERVALGDEIFRPQEVSALVVSALKRRAERVLGEAVTAAVITVPAYFSDAQRQATKEAGEIAGLEVPRILNEPTAAALAYPDGREGGRTVLVYDLGGGTFDVSVVRLEGGVTEVLASHGDVHLGGDDLDRLALERVLARIGDDELRRAAVADRGVRARLLRAAETARCRLSHEPHARIREDSVVVADGVPRHLDEEIDRSDLEEWLAPLLERAMESVHRALREAGLASRDLDEILLAGGATRTPAVHRLLEESTGRPVSTLLEPDLCVALGAGLVAGRLEGRTDAAVLVDVTPYTFGARCLGEVDGFFSRDAFTPLIRRNTPLPATCAESFVTVHDGQRRGEVAVFQGEEPQCRRNIPIGEFFIEDLQEVPAGNEVEIRFDLDVDGILAVTATERATGHAMSVRIEGAVGRLGEREVSRASERMRRLLGLGEEDVAEAPDPDGDLDPETRDLVTRAERALLALHATDRAEADDLIRALRSGEGNREETVRALEDLLFYAGEGGA